jgi:threonine synthase
VSVPEITNPGALECRECHARYPVEPLTLCEECFGPLEPSYDLETMEGVDFRKHVEAGPATLWRYEGLLPGGPGIDRVDLGAGFTPLRRAERLGERLGIEQLWIKDDSVNPSNSFKDRVVSVAISMAGAFGFEAVSCASTGNLANATAAHAAKAGMPAFVFVPEDLEPPKILATEAYGAKVVAVKGNYDEVNRLCTEVAEALPWAFINVNLRPYYAEGSKSLGFEVAEQLGWRLPDHVVVPVASGALMTKVHRAFRELVGIAAVEDRPYRISGAQAEGCAPVAEAFRSGATEVHPVKPNTIAKSLAIGNPADGWFAIQTARDTGGTVEACPEDEVVAGVRLLAETEGVFTETAGGVTVAVLRRLRESGAIGSEDETVALITGNGYKTVSALEDVVEPTYRVAPSLDEFLAALRG